MYRYESLLLCCKPDTHSPISQFVAYLPPPPAIAYPGVLLAALMASRYDATTPAESMCGLAGPDSTLLKKSEGRIRTRSGRHGHTCNPDRCIPLGGDVMRYLIVLLVLLVTLPAQAVSLRDTRLEDTLCNVAVQSSKDTPRKLNEFIVDEGFSAEGKELVNH